MKEQAGPLLCRATYHLHRVPRSKTLLRLEKSTSVCIACVFFLSFFLVCVGLSLGDFPTCLESLRMDAMAICSQSSFLFQAVSPPFFFRGGVGVVDDDGGGQKRYADSSTGGPPQIKVCFLFQSVVIGLF